MTDEERHRLCTKLRREYYDGEWAATEIERLANSLKSSVEVQLKLAERAEQAERERDKWCQDYIGLVCRAEKAERDRDEARAMWEKGQGYCKLSADEIERLVKERNEALEELRLWKLQG